MSPQSKKIAIVVDPFTILTKGGHHAGGLAQALIERGHVVQGFGAPSDKLPSSAGLDSAADAQASDRGAGLVRFGPDLILAYDALSPAAWLGARCARRLGVPLILIEPASYVPGSLIERTLWRLGESLWGRIVRKQMTALVAVDPLAAERAASEGFEPERIAVIPPGVDVDAFRPDLASPLATRLHLSRLLLYVGRIEEPRGIDVLLRAFGDTVGRRGDWSLVLAGEGDAHGRLRARAEQMGVSASVHILPKARAEELPGLFANATLVAVPALDASVRGISVLRAMAAGRPALVSDLPRLTFLVRHGETGLVVPAGDVSAWAAALRRAASAPEARARWGASARLHAESEFAWPRVVERFEQVFEGAQDEFRRRARAAG